MTDYTWKADASGDLLDASNWVQGAAPGPGDTAVIDTSALSSSDPNDTKTFLTQETLTGVSLTYRYTWDSQGFANLPEAFLTEATLGLGTTLTATATNSTNFKFGVTASGGIAIPIFGAVSNEGTIAIGTPGDGNGTKVVSFIFDDLNPGSLTNSGLIAVGYGSYYNMDSSFVGTRIDNTATGTITVSDGAALTVGDDSGTFAGPNTPTQALVNDGLMMVQGTVGTTTVLNVNIPVQGSGTIVADGGSSTTVGQTVVAFNTDISGINVELANHAEAQDNQNLSTPLYSGGSVTFEDGTGVLYATPQTQGSQVVSRPIYGFQAGDVLGVRIGLYTDTTNSSRVLWNQASHMLSVMSGTNVLYSFNLMGTYSQSDFSFAYQPSVGSVIDTTSTANAAVTRSTTSSGQVVLSTATGGPITTAVGGSTQVTLGMAYSSVTSQGSDAITAGAGQASVVASGASTTVTGGTGRLSFQGGAGSAVVSTGPGGSSVTTGTGSSQVFLGAGTDVVNAHGQDFVAASSGADTVYAASAVLAYGGASGQLTVVSGAAASTVVGGGGDATVYGSTGGGVVYGGTGSTEFVGGAGASTFGGGGGAALVYGGAGGGAIFGGPGDGQFFGASASSVIEVGTGASTVTASDGNVVFLVGAAPGLVVAGAGNVTLAGSASSGSNSLFAGFGADQISGGSGNDSFVAGTGQATLSGGGGSNVFGFVNGDAGGSDVITDFRPEVDHLSLQGYAAGAVGAALSRASVSGGATALTLGDGTRVTLQGVTKLGVGDFV